MGIRVVLEITNGQPVVDVERLASTALLAQPRSASETRFSRRFPPDPVQGSRLPTSPSRVGTGNLKFRLPFRHARAGAKRFLAVEVARGAAEIFAAPHTRFRDAVASARIRPSDLSAFKALTRAELLGPLAGRCAGLSADGTLRGGLSITPARKQVAMRGTESSRLSVGRERRTTPHTVHGSIVQHGIEIEEKYCEIAAKRLAQEVFPFESELRDKVEQIPIL